MTEVLHVRCLNTQCAAPAAAAIPIVEIAPGVQLIPRDQLFCKSCHSMLWTERAES